MNKKRFFEKFSDDDTDEGSQNKPGIICIVLRLIYKFEPSLRAD